LGIFAGDYFSSGVALLNSSDDGDYFGDYVAVKKTGYGELKDLVGDVKLGRFLNGELQNGYIQQRTASGFQYIKIQNGINFGADNMNGQYFFEQVQELKNN
jgi:pimeloyl-CoA synthetase